MVNEKLKKQREKIKLLVKAGCSSTHIQKTLSKSDLGMRRKTLLMEIRRIKETPIKPNSYKYTRKKYRKVVIDSTGQTALGKRKEMYRCSVAINGVPVHNKYLSFLIQAWSKNKSFLNSKISELKSMLLNEITEYLGYGRSEWWFNFYMATEHATEVIVLNEALERTWEFKVERDGGIVYGTNGRI